MLSKIFRSQKSGQAAFLLMMASVLSYVAGLLRDRTLSHTFGATHLTDAFNASFIIPDFMFNMFIAGALSVAFIPVFTSYLKEDQRQAEDVANTIITFGTLILGFVGVVVFIIAPYIIPAIFSSTPANEHELIITMTRILLVSPILFAVSNALGSILITHKNFLAYALSGFLYNLGIIFGVIILHEKLGIYSAAVGAIIGAFFHLAVRILNILTVKYKFRPTLSLRHAGVKKIFWLMIPKTVGLLSWQAMIIVYTIVAYSLGEGSVAAYNYARNLQSFPVSLFGIAFATAIFPFLSDHAHNEASKKFSEDFQITLEKILFFVIPGSLGMLLLSREIIEIILKGGVFDQAAVTLTASVLFFFTFSIPVESLVHLFARGYYAYKNTIIPMIFAIAGYGSNIVACIILAKIIGVVALPIAFLIGSSIQLFLLMIFIRKRISHFDTKSFIIKFLKISAASAIMGAAVIIIPQFLSTSFLTLQLIRVIVGACLYLLVAYILRCPELNFFKRA
ncbi:murein biosynthesis integral membrane protein MurJ [bacterium]|nr:murein biosynthesis integral membrane protein MurJ [bacterium]